MAENKEGQEFSGKTLARIEQQIKAHYTTLRRERGTPNYAPSVKTDNDWMRAAEQVHNAKANPFTWVEAQFEKCATGRFPHPNNIYGQKAEEQYQDYIQEFAGLPAQEIHCMGLYVQDLVNRAGWSEEEVFLAWHMDDLLRPYYKVLFCPESILEEIKGKYGAPATVEIEDNKSLREYLQKNHANRIERIIRQEVPAGHVGAPASVPPAAPSVGSREGGPRRFCTWDS